MKIKQSVPPESIREHVHLVDGVLWWKVQNENKNRDLNHPIGYRAKRVYPTFRFNDERYAVHRITHWLNTGEWPEIVDHIDGNPLNAHKDNLRAANHAENKVNSNNSYYIETKVIKSGAIRYKPRITIDGATYNLGTYGDLNTAQYVAWKARNAIFPGFAKLPPFLAELLGVQDKEVMNG